MSTACLALLLAFTAAGANADSLAINFENPPYTPGSIDGQDGWGGGCPGGPINPLIDEEVVANGAGAPASFEDQSWRFSSAYMDGAFTWPFSPSLASEAGETEAANGGCSGGPRHTHFEVQWSFASSVPDSVQQGLQMSTAPDRGDGARMSFIRMEDEEGGLDVYFADYQSGLSEPGCVLGTNFVTTLVATGLDRTVPHTVKLTMDFVDGIANDIVNVYVDGALSHTGTSWEDYFRECEGNPPRTVDSMIFQARGSGTAPLLLGQGFLIDNLSYSTASIPLTKNDCKMGGWKNLTRADGTPFANQGDCIQYLNTGV